MCLEWDAPNSNHGAAIIEHRLSLRRETTMDETVNETVKETVKETIKETINDDIENKVQEKLQNENEKNKWTVIPAGTSNDTRYLIPRLEAGTRYVIRVSSKNICGWSDWSGCQTFTTSAKPPSPPSTPPSIEVVTFNSVSITWNGSKEDGGDPIIGYR